MAQRKDDASKRRSSAALSILVVRSGGFAGLRQQWQVDAHDNTEEWQALVQACPWGAVGGDAASRDRFVWRIEARMPRTIRTASVPDALLVGPWRALVDRVQKVGAHG